MMSLEHSHFNVEAKEFDKVVKVPASKSYANRVLILAAICEEEVEIENIPLSSDVEKMISCLKTIGLNIEVIENKIFVRNSFPKCEEPNNKPIVLHTGDGGTTNRFLIPLLGLGNNTYHVEAKGGMRDRPMEELVNALRKLKVEVRENKEAWLSIKGPVVATPSLDVDCSRSTQFATGLCLTLLNHDVEVKVKNLDASKSYFELTEKLIEEFRSGKREFAVPVDFSSLSYPLALGAVSKSVLISNCFEIDKTQADSVFLSVLEKIGAKVEWLDEGLRCSFDELKFFELDCSSCPDLTPTLAFVASFCEGETLLTNLEVLHHKESDRVDEIIKLLKAFKVTYKYDSENEIISIVGNSVDKNSFVEYTPAEDHRMVMVSYLFMRMCSGGKLHNANHVKKSFANFFEVMS